MMKKKIVLILVAFVAMMTKVFSQQDVKNMAVATFDVTGNAVTKDEADAITELYITELVRTNKVNVVDRANFDKLIKEMSFQTGDWSNPEKTIALGNALNAQIIARGQIIKLGSKMYLSATVIDAKTAKVISSARKQFDNIDDIFNLLKPFADDLVISLSRVDVDWENLEIGSLGPGGGLIFHIEGNKYYECSELLGVADWESGAEAMCKAYKGGGYTDWYLPTEDELNYIYWNLRKTGKISGNDWYWSSSHSSTFYVWVQRFSDGRRDSSIDHSSASVRAVRVFSN